MFARKKNQMISSIKFLDAENNPICAIEGSNQSGEKFVIELGENEYIVGCRQFNNASLRDIEFRILDKGKLGVFKLNDESTISSLSFMDTRGVK